MEGMNEALHQLERIAARVKLIEPQIEGFGVSDFLKSDLEHCHPGVHVHTQSICMAIYSTTDHKWLLNPGTSSQSKCKINGG